MTTPTHRVPAGVPTGGQFAPSAHAEAQVSLDGPRRTLPDLPGLDHADSITFRRLDHALRRDYTGDLISPEQRSTYRGLANRVDDALRADGAEAYERPDLAFLDCPRHGDGWGRDTTCEACTDLAGMPLPIRSRLEIATRLGPGGAEFLAGQKARVVRDAKVDEIVDDLEAIEGDLEDLPGYHHSMTAARKFSDALGDAWEAFDNGDQADTAAYADALDAAKTHLWEIASDLGYNTEAYTRDTGRRDRYFENEIDGFETRLTAIADRVRTLDETDTEEQA